MVCIVEQFLGSSVYLKRDFDAYIFVQEWIPAYRVAASDKLGMRCEGRLTLRPCPPEAKLTDECILEIGTPVDAWWNDGWWEGVVTGLEKYGSDALLLYFPGMMILTF